MSLEAQLLLVHWPGGMSAKPYSIAEAQLRSEVDGQTVMEHLEKVVITQDVNKAKTDVMDFAKQFISYYGLNFYHVAVVNNKDEIITEIISIPRACGTLENKCGDDGKQPCVAYCESTLTTFHTSEGMCFEGRVPFEYRSDYGIRFGICSWHEICCFERYDWSSPQHYETTGTTWQQCGPSLEGVCEAGPCEEGRVEINDVNKDCERKGVLGWIGDKISRKACCKPLKYSELFEGTEGTGIKIPIVYKETRTQPGGVLGYAVIEVGKNR